MVVGITGRIASGKTLFAKMLYDVIGGTYVDVDALGHSALEQQKEQILEAFGEEVLSLDSTIDRKALGRVVFASFDALRTLENIVHPVMGDAVREIIEHQPHPIIVDAAVLNRMGLAALCDTVIFVDTPDEAIVARLAKRNSMDEERARAILEQQKDIKEAGTEADIIIVNDRDEAHLREFAKRIAGRLGHVRD